MGDSDSDTESSDDEKTLGNLRKKRGGRRGFMKGNKDKDLEADAEDYGTIKDEHSISRESQNDVGRTADGDNEKVNGAFANGPLKVDAMDKKNEESKKSKFQLPKVPAGMTSISMLEQSMPADAVLAKAGAAEVGNCSLSISHFSDCKKNPVPARI
jgi:metal transporter CNNM